MEARVEPLTLASRGFFRLHGPWGFLQMTSYTYQGQHLFGRYASTSQAPKG